MVFVCSHCGVACSVLLVVVMWPSHAVPTALFQRACVCIYCTHIRMYVNGLFDMLGVGLACEISTGFQCLVRRTLCTMWSLCCVYREWLRVTAPDVQYNCAIQELVCYLTALLTVAKLTVPLCQFVVLWCLPELLQSWASTAVITQVSPGQC